MAIAIIPARGGSKRIPGKNIRMFAGRPMISYSIEAAIQSEIFTRVIVSTDDPGIAQIAQTFGAEVPFLRPAELSDDYADTAEVTTHAIKWLEQHGESAEFVCCIYATAPFLRAEDLLTGYGILKEADKQFVFSATSFSFPIQRALRMTEAGVAPFFPEYIESRSQDLEGAYHDAGQFYWGRAAAFCAGLPLFADHSAAVVLPRYRVQDIDTLEDWSQAELIADALARRGASLG